jgi:hypothetical protein
MYDTNDVDIDDFSVRRSPELHSEEPNFRKAFLFRRMKAPKERSSSQMTDIRSSLHSTEFFKEASHSRFTASFPIDVRI